MLSRARLPEVFPLARPDRPDRRYPQTIMSPSFTITESVRYESVPDGPPRFVPFFVVRGNGWGHLVGMSQYGAEAMASAGESAEDIVAHFYGGLRPARSALVPTTVRIGLTTNDESVLVEPSGAVRVVIDGVEISPATLGAWSFRSEGGAMIITPPEGLGLAPDIEDVRVFTRGDGVVELIAARLVAAAEVRFVVAVGGDVVDTTPWEVRNAGTLAFGPTLGPVELPITVEIQTRSPDGSDTVARTIIPDAA